MKLSNFSSLVRTIDPKYPTNLAIVSISIITGGVFLFIAMSQGLGFQSSFSSAVAAGFSVFLTWALSREIDPDHQLSAFIGLVLVVSGFLFLGAPNLLTLFSLLILARTINRSTGLPAKLLDSILILGLGTWLSFSGYPIYGILTAIAFILDSRLPDPNRRHIYFSLLMAGITLVVAFSLELEFPEILITRNELVILCIIGVLYLPLMISSQKTESMCDFTEEYIIPVRLQTTQVFMLLSGMIVWLLQGTSGLTSTLPLWCAIVGVSLYYLTTELYRTLRRS